MKGKQSIIAKLRKHRPVPSDQVAERGFPAFPDPVNQFVQSLDQVGGTLIAMRSLRDWNAWIRTKYGTGLHVYSEIDALPGNFKLDPEPGKFHLNEIDVAALEGEFGVAENGAVWVEKFAHRAIPFIAQHLVLVLRKANIISNMHEAYEELAEFGLPDFGVFIAGPSKTADIEQSLVFGAHGPKTLVVVLI